MTWRTDQTPAQHDQTHAEAMEALRAAAGSGFIVMVMGEKGPAGFSSFVVRSPEEAQRLAMFYAWCLRALAAQHAETLGWPA
jgi:hypothetical protein